MIAAPAGWTRLNDEGGDAAAEDPTPTLNSLTIGRLSEVIWVISTPSDQMTSASYGPRVHSRNIRMLESKPTSMPPSPLSRTIGNFAMTTISGIASSCGAGRGSDAVPRARRGPGAEDQQTHAQREHAEVEPAAARGEQRSQASEPWVLRVLGRDGTSISHAGAPIGRF